MSRPAPDTRSQPAPGDLEDIWVVHSSLTTRLHYEQALNGHLAFGKWCRRLALPAACWRDRLCSRRSAIWNWRLTPTRAMSSTACTSFESAFLPHDLLTP